MIRRSLSFHVFVITLVSLAAGASGFHFVRQWQLTRLSETFLDRASDAEAKGDWIRAADNLDRYLRFEPQDAPVRRRLAEVYAKGAQSFDEKQRAVALHYRALAASTNVDATDLRVTLAELLLQTNRLAEAEHESEQILKKEDENARASRVFAIARYLQWSRGDFASTEAQELDLLGSIEAALTLNPADIALAEFGAKLYREYPAIVEAYKADITASASMDRADKLLDQAVQYNPGNAEARLARHLYRDYYGLEGAQPDLEAALAAAPLHPRVLLVAAESNYRRAKDTFDTKPEAARELLPACKRYLNLLIEKKLTPDDPQPQLRLGDVLVLEGNLDEALAVWKRGLVQFSKPTHRVVLQARMADHLLRAARFDEAKAALDATQASVDVLGGIITRAEHLKFRQAQSIRQATYDLTQGYFQKAIDLLRLAIAQQPKLQPDAQTSHVAWELLGRGHVGLGQSKAAAEAFDRAANFEPTLRVRLAAAEAWLNVENGEPLAIERAEQAIELKPTPAQIRWLASVLADHGEERGLAKAIEILNQNIQGHAVAEVDYAMLSELYELQASATSDPVAKKQLQDSAGNAAKSAAAANPEHFRRRALAFLRKGQFADAIGVCQAQAEIDPTSHPAVVLTSLLLEVGAAPEQLELAESFLAGALQKFPNDFELLYGVGMLRVIANRYPEAIGLLRRVIQHKPLHVSALNNLAMLLAESESTRPEALELVERAIEHRGKESTLFDTKGTILLRMGRPQEAVQLLASAASGRDADPRYHFHLALAYQDLQMPDKARQELATATKNNLEQQILTPTDRQALSQLRSKRSSSDSRTR